LADKPFLPGLRFSHQPIRPTGTSCHQPRSANFTALAFSPLQFRLEDLVAEEDRVVVRWCQTGTHAGPFMGIPPSGRQFTITGIDIHQLRDGRMAEHWHVVDLYGLLQQLGAIPAPNTTSV
jgi:steroid delta-isomerase-like uncharacterized protein